MEEMAHLLAASYRGHIDSELNDQYGYVSGGAPVPFQHHPFSGLQPDFPGGRPLRWMGALAG